MKLKGYTLPLSSTGTGSLVPAPPWYFGGDTIEISYYTDINKFKSFLPEPLEISEYPGLVAISMVDMTSVCNSNMAYNTPFASEYKECLIKLHCTLNSKPYWYVPESWVNKDFSLLRGYIQGFGKKLSQISITKMHKLNPKLGDIGPGVRLKGICEAFSSIHIEASIQIERETKVDLFSNVPLCTIPHYPDIYTAQEPRIYELSEVVCENAVKQNIWEGTGEIVMNRNSLESITCLQPINIFSARRFSEGFKLVGGKKLCDLKGR